MPILKSILRSTIFMLLICSAAQQDSVGSSFPLAVEMNMRKFFTSTGMAHFGACYFSRIRLE
jgi:hypothetical protein